MKAKLTVGLCLLAAAYAHAGTDPTLTYWFDNLPGRTMPTSGGATSFEVDASTLPAGIHTLSAMVQGADGLSSARSAIFVKTFNPPMIDGLQGLVVIDGNPGAAVAAMPTAQGATFTVDASWLPVGVHTIASALVGANGESTGLAEALFLRVPTDAEISGMEAHYIIDDDFTTIGKIKLDGQMPAFKLDIDVASLSTGLHTVTVFCTNGKGFGTNPTKSFFIKIPNGGEGIAAYEYWIDDSPRTKVRLEKPEIPLTLVKMMELPVADFHSASFELKMEEGVPMMYGRHNFNFLCYDGDYRAALGNREYVESRNPMPVTDITELTEKTGSLRTSSLKADSINWYSIEMKTGDSIALSTWPASMIDVFTPQGERVYQADRSESYNMGGVHAYEDGRYLIAVHDAAQSGGTVNFKYQHIDKYEILKSGPRSTAAADLVVLKLVGNGFEHLKEATLTCGSETFTTHKVTDLGMGEAALHFNLKDAPVGTYSLTAHYDDGLEAGDVERDNILDVREARPGEIRTSAARTVFGTTLNDVRLTVTNTGNVPYWGVPLSLGVEADGTEDIKVHFKDFIPFMPGDKEDEWTFVMTENLLGTGKAGMYLPMILPYLGPNETKELTIVYQMPLQVHIPTYIWAGRPWSDEFEELIQLAQEDKPFPIKNENYISATTLMLCDAVATLNGSTSDTKASSGTSRAYVDYSQAGDAVDLAARLGEHMDINTRPLADANTVAQRAVGIGNTLGGIVNGLRARQLDAYVDAYGIDLSDGTFSSLADYRSDLIQSMPNPDRIIDDNFNPQTGVILKWLCGSGGNKGGCARTPYPMPRAHDIVQMTSCDPNDITGYQDPSGGRFVGLDVAAIPYTIEFENDPALATAPAHVINITDCLDTSVFDLSTLKIKEIEIGKKSLKIDEEADFTATLDMRPEINSIAEIDFTIDKTSGEAAWIIRTLDPMTMEAATEVEQGVLPINNAENEGCGKILFDVNLKEGVESGVAFENKATIVFDGNEPIATPAWENTTDFIRPIARISAVHTSDYKTFAFDVETTEDGSGIWNYNLYFRALDSKEWILLRGAINPEELTYVSEAELIGNFCVEATDKAGNLQTDTPKSVLLGDADNNGIIDATDVVVLRNYFTGVNKAISTVAADVNLDYTIDSQDGVEIINLFLHGGSQTKTLRTRKYSLQK